MNALNEALFWCVLQTSLLALVALLLGARPWRMGGALGPLVGLLAIFVLTVLTFVPTPAWNLRSWFQDTVVHALPSQLQNLSLDPLEFDRHEEAGNGEIQPPSTEVLPSAASYGNQLPMPAKAQGKIDRLLLPVMLGVIGFGMALGTLRLLMGIFGTKHLLQSGGALKDQRIQHAIDRLKQEMQIEKTVEVFESPHLSTAATIGSWRPVLFLPKHWRDWSDVELRTVLAHELAHIRNGDFAAGILSQISLVLHFYHPLVHWLSNRMRLEQELAADSLAASIVGGTNQYTRVLAKLALEHQDQNVGWPARAFLPTRHAFLRRLEMLRDLKGNEIKRLHRGRWLAVAIIAVSALSLFGLKPHTNIGMAFAGGEFQGTPSDTNYELRYLDDQDGIVIALKPSILVSDKRLGPIAETIGRQTMLALLCDNLNLKLEEIEEVVGSFNIENMEPISLFVRASKPIEPKLKGKQGTLSGKTVSFSPSGEQCFWLSDQKTLVFGSTRSVERFIQGRTLENSLVRTEVWNQLKAHPFVCLADFKNRQGYVKLLKRSVEPFAPFVQGALDEATIGGIAISNKENFKIEIKAKCSDAQGVAKLQESTSAAMVLLKNALREAEKAIATSGRSLDDGTAAASRLLPVGSKLLESVKLDAKQNTLSLSMNANLQELPTDTVNNVLAAAKKGGNRTQAANQLKQIALGFHNFASAMKTFPHVSKSSNDNHLHPVSWRVLILPFIEQTELYNQYRFDEPWDGPNNSKLLAKMPAIYRHPDAPAGSTNTNFAVVQGKDTIFLADRALKFNEITDGSSNTILLVETNAAIPWTKPEDLTYEADKELPKMGGFSDQGFQVAFADGAVRFLAKTLDPAMLRALLTARGGEVFAPK